MKKFLITFLLFLAPCTLLLTPAPAHASLTSGFIQHQIIFGAGLVGNSTFDGKDTVLN